MGCHTQRKNLFLKCVRPSMQHYFKGTEEPGNQFLNLLYHWLQACFLTYVSIINILHATIHFIFANTFSCGQQMKLDNSEVLLAYLISL
jgi:hypothetical protein